MKKSYAQWQDWFHEHFAPAELKDADVRAYLHHLADLGCFETAGGDWSLTGGLKTATDASLKQDLANHLDALSRTEKGFALSGLLGRKPEFSADAGGGATASGTSPLFGKKKHPAAERSSDLSNLQIVKKVGRQLQDFLELEQSLVSRLQGTHTTKEDAKRIFNHLLSKSREKSPPRQWEQLSRKRHR